VASTASSRPPQLPQDWGGSDAARWRPEAILANATSAELNRAWSSPQTQDAIVAVPVRLERSQFHPYGDGQSNAAPSFGDSWRESRPPVLATFISRADGTSIVRFVFDRSLNISAKRLRIAPIDKTGKNAAPAGETILIAGQKDEQGNWIAEWTSPSLPTLPTLPTLKDDGLWIQPENWKDGFAFRFRHPVFTVDELRAKAVAPDPEGIAIASAQSGKTPFETLITHSFKPAFNATPYNPQNIHAEFPAPGGVVTGVGQGWTWVAEKPAVPFKTLYTCFERRNAAREAQAKDGGVASGGGWHEIGDPAETILNTLERDPIVVGWGGRRFMEPAGREGAFAYGLQDIVTVRWLRPGEAMLTAAGDFHWFYFQADREVCTEEWVHPCVPSESNSLGFRCGG
jgi:hypothetical protein